MLPLSVLDLAPIVEGGDAARALRNSLDLAGHAERLGYRRFWVAEHHGMPGVASAATAVVIAHVAGGTSTIRVGAGGIMLPNHAPLVIAEQFGTLESLFPGRIDLGLGRAPGTDPVTAGALRRSLAGSVDRFPEDVLEVMAYLDDPAPGDAIVAVPGAGLKVPIWILGSSLYGAQLAAAFGLPYAFASHFAPDQLDAALDAYRARYRPSERNPRPYAMAGVNVVAAESDEEARLLATSLQQVFVSLRRGRPIPFPAPKRGFDAELAPEDRAILERTLSCSFVGTVETVRRGLAAFLERTRVDELIVSTPIFDHAARVRSLELTMEAVRARDG